MEYCVSAWNPLRKKDKKRLELVQRRATKLVPQFKNLNYESRLINLDLPTLELRRLRGGLIQCYKFVNDFDCVNWKNGNVLVKDRRSASQDLGVKTRGHQQKLEAQFSKLDSRKHFFTNRIVDEWNKLDRDVVSAKSVNEFKNRLDSYWKLQRSKKMLATGLP